MFLCVSENNDFENENQYLHPFVFLRIWSMFSLGGHLDISDLEGHLSSSHSSRSGLVPKGGLLYVPLDMNDKPSTT